MVKEQNQKIEKTWNHIDLVEEVGRKGDGSRMNPRFFFFFGEWGMNTSKMRNTEWEQVQGKENSWNFHIWNHN